ncbi:MAG: universal stress protein [Anaerolineales bacterium]|nr:universal stress protein [Anaerolineales bacterium]MCB8959768.1 universal stress protein [Ardenticatenales bacterium]MCB0007708.1 universal stress protein [Anaerolineales bacterium]MCB0011139.1 universal stress protein [Anaerolineales bacterium]MCB0016749.1 universal stress protein [Anaerolineales bacterium]
MFKRILVPLDGSHLAEVALQPACELAARFDGEITLLRVTSTPLVFSQIDGSTNAELLVTMREHNRKEAEEYLNGMKGSLRQQGYIVHTHLLEDEGPADAILATVEAQGMDIVVMSTHGRGGVARWVFGSVADRVLRYSPVPVLLMRAETDTERSDQTVAASEAV